VAVDRAGRVTAGGRDPLQLGEAWTPEHLLLAALALCSVASLVYHTRRASLDLVATAAATGAVSRRSEDHAWALIDVECRIDVELDPSPPGDEVSALLAKAERGCFIGASLTDKPEYRWTINGEVVP
jgi:organic hydroperoxide reductase OsmC/OhrA